MASVLTKGVGGFFHSANPQAQSSAIQSSELKGILQQY
jgi:hypothetical protein